MAKLDDPKDIFLLYVFCVCIHIHTFIYVATQTQTMPLPRNTVLLPLNLVLKNLLLGHARVIKYFIERILLNSKPLYCSKFNLVYIILLSSWYEFYLPISFFPPNMKI